MIARSRFLPVVLILSCARTGLVEESPGRCVDAAGDEIPGNFAASCGGWGDRCQVCGELQTCDNETRACSDTCGPMHLFCANEHDCPVKTCAVVSCEGNRCAYRTSIVEGGGCVATDGAQVFGGVCDDCDCVPIVY